MLRHTLIATALGALLAAPALASTFTYHAMLDGLSEIPTVTTPGSGEATVIIDDIAHSMRVIVDFSGLLGSTNAAHIHCCVASSGGNLQVATQSPNFSGFPLGVSAGSYDNTFDLDLASTYRVGFVTAFGGSVPAAKAALLGALDAGTAYLNIHTDLFPGGEIRGLLQAVPEPGVPALLAAASLALLATRRRRPTH